MGRVTARATTRTRRRSTTCSTRSTISTEHRAGRRAVVVILLRFFGLSLLQDTEQGERKGEGVGRAYGFGFARINLFVWPSPDGGVCRQDLLKTKVLLNKKFK